MSITGQVEEYLKERFRGEFKVAIMCGTIESPNALYYYVRDLMTRDTLNYKNGVATELDEFAVVHYLSHVRWSHVYYSLKAMGNESQPVEPCLAGSPE